MEIETFWIGYLMLVSFFAGGIVATIIHLYLMIKHGLL